MIKLCLLLFTTFLLSQQGYVPKQQNKLKGWVSSNEFSKPDVIAVNFSSLIDKFLNKSVKPIKVSKEFRDYLYKNFYLDQNLKKSIKDRKASGWKQHSSNGNFGTLAYYSGNSSYEILNDKVFIVMKITPISKIKHVAKTDDSNYIFKLYNKELGDVYYEYSSKYKDDIEIELLNQ